MYRSAWKSSIMPDGDSLKVHQLFLWCCETISTEAAKGNRDWPLSRHPAAAADPLGLTMAFQRKKPAAIGVKAPFPGFIEPALATSIQRVPAGERWIHEIKFDGYRVQLHLANEAVKIYTRFPCCRTN
jgi:ATP-dependent DNA ligase